MTDTALRYKRVTSASGHVGIATVYQCADCGAHVDRSATSTHDLFHWRIDAISRDSRRGR